MKRLTWLAVLLLLSAPALADTSTTHYSFTAPSIGNTTNWGLSLNSNFTSLDSNLWNASSGTTIGVNAPSASGSNIVLTNPINSVQSLAFTTTGKSVQLPVMNASSSPVSGGTFRISNVGSNAFGVLEADGSTVLVSNIAAGQSVAISPTSNASSNGTFNVYGPYLSSVGTVFLGSSTTGTSPSITGDATSGFYTPSAGNLSAAISGVQTWLLNNAGSSVVGNASATKAFLLTGTAAASTGQTGVHSPTTNSLCLETTGTDSLCQAANGGLTIGAPVGGSLGAGSLNLTTTLAINGVSVLSSGAIKSIHTQTFCASGCTHTSGTYTPTTGMAYAIVEIVGGGGGGGGVAATFDAASGGGSGGYDKVLETAGQIGASQTITVAAAGTAGPSGGGTGGTGGTSSVGSLISCTGGTGGSNSGQNNAVSGGTGGVCTVSTGTALIPPTAGQPGEQGAQNGNAFGGAGGGNPLGFGGQPILWPGTNTGSAAGTAGNGFGSGGGGATNGLNTTAEAGGSAGGGIVSITEFCTQ